MNEFLAFGSIAFVAILIWGITTWRWVMRQHPTIMPTWALRFRRWRMGRQILTMEGDEILNAVEDELLWRESHQ